MLLRELKALCRKHQLPVGGRKADLQARLLQAGVIERDELGHTYKRIRTGSDEAVTSKKRVKGNDGMSRVTAEAFFHACQAPDREHNEKLRSCEEEEGEEAEGLVDQDTLGPLGWAKLLADASIDEDDPITFAIAWRFGSQEVGFFPKQKFVDACFELGVYDVKSFIAAVDALRTRVLRDPDKLSVWRNAFDLMKDSEQSRAVDADVASVVVNVLGMGDPIMGKFVTFLSECSIRGVTRDQWNLLPNFVSSLPDQWNTYDETSAWPLLFDQFVDWLRGGTGLPTPASSTIILD